MACSRTPKWILRPTVQAVNDCSSFRSVLFEGPRSAEPPSSSGNLSARALSTLPLAWRVASFSPGANSGRVSQPAGSLPSASSCHSASAWFRAASRCSRLPFLLQLGPPGLARPCGRRPRRGRRSSASGSRPKARLVGLQLRRPQRGAVGIVAVLLGRGAEADMRAGDDQRRPRRMLGALQWRCRSRRHFPPRRAATCQP